MLPYVCLPTRVITDPAVSAPALRVFCLLASYADRDGWCWPALRTLGEQLGMARSTVCDHISHLVLIGHVTKAQKTLPSGLAVTAYMPRIDATKTEAIRQFRRHASRSGVEEDRSGEPNGRSENAPPAVRTTRTMEVETTKKGAERAASPEAGAADALAPRGGKPRPFRELMLELGFEVDREVASE